MNNSKQNVLKQIFVLGHFVLIAENIKQLLQFRTSLNYINIQTTFFDSCL